MALSKGETKVDYGKIVESIPTEKWNELTSKLIDCILTSKNDEKMPNQLANNILHNWQQGILQSKSGLTALLEAALLLEPEKTTNAFNELQMTSIAEQIKGALGS